MAKRKYESDVELGKQYRDEQTGFVGIATIVSFFQHGCERVVLESSLNSEGKILTESFDSPRLVSMDTGRRANASRPGGPGNAKAVQRPVAAAR